jgi:hypothetical protein
MRLPIRALFAVLFLYAGAASAQFVQYTPPGGPARPPESRKEELEREIEEARYRLGPVRVEPWLRLRDVAYVRSFFSSGVEIPSDFTATVGAGLRGYLRTGRKVMWTAQVLPEYVWWADQQERRRLNGVYGLGVYGFFNRLTVEATAGREQEQRIVTPEVPQPVSARGDGANLLVEVEVSGAFSVFAASSLVRQENLVDDLDDPRTEGLDLLDRDERVARAGVRWRPREKWTISLGAERSEVDFNRSALDRSNSGTAPVLGVRLDGSRVLAEVNLAARALEARQGARFADYDGVTGNAAVTLSGGSLQYGLYGSRNLVYTLTPEYAYLEDERLGAVIGLTLSRRSQARLFAETGANDYTVLVSGTPERQDDLTSYGASLRFGVRDAAGITLAAVRSEFDSNLPGRDRTYTSVGITINIIGDH